MPTTTARLVELGMVPIVAREVVGQFAGTITPPSSRRFIAHGVPSAMAQELATQAGGTKDARRLIELGMAPGLAREVVS